MTDSPDLDGPVLVGFDGSTTAAGAVDWAAAQSARTGSRLEVVTAWEYPSSWGTTIPLPDGFDPAADAQALCKPVVEQLRAGHPGLDVHAYVVEGNPGDALVAASRRASLLVVGSRGHRVLAGMLLGSVSQQCVTHAACPVVVYRERPAD